MIIMYPNEVVWLENIVQSPGEQIVDPQITGQIAAGKFGKIDAVMQDRPQHSVGKAVVIFLEVLATEISDDIGDLVTDDFLQLDLGSGRHLPAPAEPDSRSALESRFDGDFEATSACPTLLRHRHPVRHYHK